MLCLYIESGPDRGMLFAITPDRRRLRCGRDETADVILTDNKVSYQHFEMVRERSDAPFYLEDLGSTNGTEINGRSAKRLELRLGDRISVGLTVLRLEEQRVIAEERASRRSRRVLTPPMHHDESLVLLEDAPEIEGFEILARLGKGGMGEIFKARQTSLDRLVALKILPQDLTRDEEFVEQFLHEARAAGQLTHANIVLTHDVGEDRGLYYIVMEYISGGSLDDVLQRETRLSPETALRVTQDIARGLEYADHRGFVHCDIKPENIMLTGEGIAKIADMGITRHVSERQAEIADDVFGSPQYMAPEQARGRPVDHRSDLYALGCVLYRMLAGVPPFDAEDSQDIMQMQVSDDPEPLAKLAVDAHPELIDIAEKLMAKQPRDRLQTATDLLRALEEVSQKNHVRKPVSRRATRRVKKKTTALADSAAEGETAAGESGERFAAILMRKIVLTLLAVVALVVLGCLVYEFTLDEEEIRGSAEGVRAADSVGGAP